jgi:head-tail adaptor
MTQIGRRDARIIIQRATELVDSQGSVYQSWSTLATVWAFVQTLNSKEITNGAARMGSTETLFSIRYQSALATLNPVDRIVWGTAVYDVASAIPLPQGRPSEIILTGTLITDIAAIATGGSLTHNGTGITHDGVGLDHTAPVIGLTHDAETLTHDGTTIEHTGA